MIFGTRATSFTPNILLANDGTQYVTLLGDGHEES